MFMSDYFVSADIFDSPIFNLIKEIQNKAFNSFISETITVYIHPSGPRVCYREPYDPYNHRILLNIHPNYPYQIAYQFSHEYSHIKMQFWKTYGYSEYTYNFFEEALAFCASIWTLRQLSTYPQSRFADTVLPQEFLRYAENERSIAEQKIIIDNPKTWWKENFLRFHNYFCVSDGIFTDEARDHVNKLGTLLLPLAQHKGFWPAAGCLTTSFVSSAEKTPAIFPTTSEQFFATWASGCTPDGAAAVEVIRYMLT